MNTCGDCGADLVDGEEHLHIDCITTLQSRIETLEKRHQGLEDSIEAYKRQMAKLRAIITENINSRSPPSGLRVVRAIG